MVYYAWQNDSAISCHKHEKPPKLAPWGAFLSSFLRGKGSRPRLVAVNSTVKPFTMKPQEVKPKAQTDWLGFRKGVRTYVQRAFLMKLSRETGTKATMTTSRDG